MLLSIGSLRRRSWLTILVLGLAGFLCVVVLRHGRALPAVYRLPEHATTTRWSKAAHDRMKQRIQEATAATSSWWWWWRRQQRGLGGPDELLLDVANATLGFQEIFVVNLPARTDRRDAMVLAAGLTGLHVSFSDGVDSRAVADRVLPVDSANKHILPGNKGSWRAHMNVLQSIIERNLTTALIMEDDIDWDVRLKAQMVSFALAARAFHQPLRGTNRTAAFWHTPPFDKDGRAISLDSQRHHHHQQQQQQEQQPLPRKGQQPTTAEAIAAAAENAARDEQRKHDVPLEAVPAYDLPHLSPYGDDWDVLWLGHCGTEFPASPPMLSKQPDAPDETTAGSGGQGAKQSATEGSAAAAAAAAGAAPAQLPLLRVTLADDPTVPAPASLKPHPFALPDALGTLYPPHTRVVHPASGTLCTQAYAVSQRGARKLLYQFGLASFTTGWDLLLRDWCDGLYRQGPGTQKRRRRRRQQQQQQQQPTNGERSRRRDDSRDEGDKGGGGGDDDDGPVEPVPQCLTVQPPLFSHYLTAKAAHSDIQAQGGGFVHKTGSQYIRLSVQRNLRRLVNGARIDDLWDQWPGDDEDARGER
ncbi:glycosyltransferase family 25 protein [Niveomyces insectorum RCEF 264]|uniref:Glycosyltransferase family 25 protein n=1 Tax=Niveomyces insectorum RCEF 264 TaxID=1081102 RepID=A0A167YUA8_9HYPO|nr:glycosyltransferase family 25 protein [Niveomyces insectorum RCEF 264]